MPDTQTILHVEDSIENRTLVRRLLQFEGYEVLEAGNAEEALQVLEHYTPHLILMDMNMPNVDGYTLTRQVKMNPRLHHIPIIAITANVMRGDRERSMQAGCDGYIEKPIDVDQFGEEIARYIQPGS
ncbi:MAG: response regulator [Anaerolineaceae bacterium]|nr:response regulator [Anaerolineaceae bacterium]